MYRKLKRTWSHNDMNYIPRFRETFPELNKVSDEEMCDRWIKLGVDFYHEELRPVKTWVRLTLPFAIILIILMLICLPILFLATGGWKYPLGNKNVVLNWFRVLKLF